jgi:phosphatidylglycerol---prolipoprotein diacylglyceryl transferase
LTHFALYLDKAAIGPFGSPLHGFFVLLGSAVAAGIFLAGARRRQLPAESTTILLAGALAGGALGAKLAVVWRFVESDAAPTLVGLLLDGGQSVLGGLAGAYLGVVLTKRLIGHAADTGDFFAPAAALGIGIGRIGCLLTEPPGIPTGASWGVVVNAARAARISGFPPAWVGVPLHPSFVYEIPFHFAMAAILFRLRALGLYRDRLFKLYCLAYAPFRFLLEFVRGNPVVWHGLTRSQIFLIPSTLLLLAALLRRPAQARVAASPGVVQELAPQWEEI